MKTVDELYKEVISNEDLKKEYVSLKNEEEINGFLKEHDCEASAEDLKVFLENGHEIDDDELNDVAGGTCYKDDRPVVTAFNECRLFRSTKKTKRDGGGFGCCDCIYSVYTDGLLLCYNEERKGN